MTENKFSLRWNDFETNMTVALKELREEKDFFDVTIACEDNQIQAHKVILSACSTFFRNLLRRNPHQHPLLYLKGVKYKELLSILNFMYNGEVNIAQEELKEFLAVAGDLKVKGLTQKMAVPTLPTMITNTTPTKNSTPQPTKPTTQKRESTEKEPAKKRLRPGLASPAKQVHTPVRTFQQVDNDEILEVVPVQPVVKESPKLKESPKVYYSQTPRKATQDKTPAPKILEQCILEAEINTDQETEKAPEVVLEKTSKTLALTPSKGSMAMGRTNENSALQKYPGLSVSKVKREIEAKEYIFVEDLPEIIPQNGGSTQATKAGTTTIIRSPRQLTNIAPKTKTPVKILPKTPILSPKVTGTGKLIVQPGKISSPIKIVPRPITNIPYDVSTIKKFSTAWRCSICKKISSTKKIAMAHLKVAHSKVQL